MADYQAQIRLSVQGLSQLDQLERRLEEATRLLGRLENTSINIDQAASSSQRRVNSAARRRAAAGRDLRAASATIENVAQRRDARGRFIQGPNPSARRMASASLRLAQREVRESDRALREELQDRRLISAARQRYARAIDRATNIVGGVQGRVNDTSARVQDAQRGIARGSRINYLTQLYESRQARFSREGGGINLSAELQQQARNVAAAWDVASAGGRENLQLMQRLATEMAGLDQRQRELNMLGAGRSKAFEAARRGQERLDELAARPGVDERRLRRLRALPADVIAASNRGDVTGSQDAIRRMNASISRYTRELDAAAKELKDSARGALSSRIPQGPLEIASRARALRENGAPLALPSSRELYARISRSGQMAPVRLDEQQAEAQKQLSKEAKDAAGSLGRFGAKLEAENRRREKLGIGAPERIGGPVRRTGAIPMGGGLDSGIVPRALPNDKLLQQRVLASGQALPTDLLKQQAQANQRLTQEAKEAAGSVGRFADAVERERRRLEKLGISTGPDRLRNGAIPMGGQGGGAFNTLPFPAGPGNATGIAQFRQIQRGQRPGARPTGFFQGNLKSAIGEGLIGGAFPLLFGQGLGASAGGLAGGFGGGMVGGMYGFGLSLIGTALGSAVDRTMQNLGNLASSLKAPTDALAALEQSGFRVSDSLKYQVQALEAAGRAYDAQTLVLKEVERRLGAGSVRELNALSVEQKRLQEQWSVMAGQLQGALLPALVGATSMAADFAQVLNALNSIGLPKALIDLLTFTNPGFALSRAQFENAQNRGRAVAAGAAGNRQQLTPEQVFNAETARISRERELQDLQRDLQRSELDMVRRKQDIEFSIADQRRAESDYEREIADYRWSIEQRIFQARADAIRAEADVMQARSDLRTAQIGLEYDDRISGAGSDAEAQFLEASKNFLQVQEQTQNQISQDKIQTELRIEDLKRQQIDRERQLEQEKEQLEQRREQLLRGRVQLERSIADYQMQVADYQRETARKILDAWRQMQQEMQAGSAVGTGAIGGAVGPRGVDIARSLQGALGLSPAQAAGIVGNLQRESGLNPRINEGGIVGLPRGVGGYGLAQWTGGRQQQLIQFAGSAQAAGDLATQLRFLVKELQTTERRALGTLRGARTPEEAAIIFDRDFERSGIKALPERTANARAVFNALQGQAAQVGALPATANLAAPARPAAPNLSSAPDTSPLRRGMQQAGERELGAVRELLNLRNQLAQVEEQSAFNALKRAAQGPDPVSEAEDQLRLQRYLLSTGSAANENERERLDLIAGQNSELESLVRSTEAMRAQVERMQELYVQSNGTQGLSAQRAAEINEFLDERVKRQEEANRLELESLAIQQQRVSLLETEATLRQAAVTGAGLRAGLIGPEADAYERGLLRGDSPADIQASVGAARTLQDQQLIWGNLQKDIVAVSDAIAGGLTQGLADIVTGARDIKDVGKEVLDAMARTFLDSAQQQLSALLQRSFAGMVGNQLSGGGILSGLLGGGAGATGPAALGAAATAAAVPLASVGPAALAAASGLTALAATSGVSSAIGGGGGILGGLVSNVVGSVFGGGLNFGGFFAEGGTTRPGEAYIVGEEGPELFIPGTSGTVVPRSSATSRTPVAEDQAFMEKAIRLQRAGDEEGLKNMEIEVRYEATEIAGERYVTEAQFRKGMQRAAMQGRAMAYSGMRNSGATRSSLGMP